jgi:large subunit ribosomal protein L35
MAKQKTHKAFSSRVKITGSGKVLKRTAGQDHFNGRESGKVTRNKRSDKTFSSTHRRAIKTLMPNHQ